LLFSHMTAHCNVAPQSPYCPLCSMCDLLWRAPCAVVRFYRMGVGEGAAGNRNVEEGVGAAAGATSATTTCPRPL
jgi:hypothetical protein